MKYKNFEDLPVWQDGIALTKNSFLLTENRVFQGQGDIANQLQRAALSVPNNISEGFERGTTNELIQFLYYAKGSAGEVRSICHVMLALPRLDPLNAEISALKSKAESISRQLSAWCKSLQQTDIKGARYLTDATKEQYHSRTEAEGLMADLKKQHADFIENLAKQRRQQPG